MRKNTSDSRARARSVASLAVCMLAASVVSVGAASTVKVVYNCKDGSALNATFDNAAETLTLEIGDSGPITLKQAVSGSGMRFTRGSYEAYGKGDWLNVVRPGRPELRCQEIGRIGPAEPETSK